MSDGRSRLTLGALLAGLAPTYVNCDPETTIERVEVDSRRVGPGVAFFATRGVRRDAHEFVAVAASAGARVLILERGRVAPDHAALRGRAVVWLADTSAAYPELAANAFARPGASLRLAGVTGTNGKTTTTFLVGAMLRAAGRTYARLGTTGNWIADRDEPAGFTTPFPLELQALLARARDRGATAAVMEVSSHALAQGRARALEFQAVGFTSFSRDHLYFHASMGDYLAAKCLLADQLAPGGVAVAADCGDAAARFLERARGHERWLASREREDAELRVVRWLTPAELDDREPDAPAIQTAAEIATPRGRGLLRTPLIGGFNVDNALVAVGLGLGLGLSLEQALAGLRHARGAPGRLEPIDVPGSTGPTVLVDYAHTPDAVARALDAVRPACRGQLWVVLGCGGDRDPAKRPLMGQLAAAHADRFVATSDNPRTEDPASIVEQMVAGVSADDRRKLVREVDRRAAIALAVAEAAPEDLVLIAGKGHEDYQIVGTRKHHLDDREEAAAALARRRAPG